jgi:hypothetical protein
MDSINRRRLGYKEKELENRDEWRRLMREAKTRKGL